MVALKGIAHFSIPVSDLARSIRFYCDIVGCKHMATMPGGMAFLDAGGDCVVLVQQDPPINPRISDSVAVHHAFTVDLKDYSMALDSLRAHGVEVLYEETREGGIVNGPRAYFRDPDGTSLEYINLTSYAGAKLRD